MNVGACFAGVVEEKGKPQTPLNVHYDESAVIITVFEISVI